MDRHPIENIMTTTMENIKDMVDVNTVIGDPVQTMDGSTVIPISRVSFGFVAGGGEYEAGKLKAPPMEDKLPFAGGTGAGVSVCPMGFLVVNDTGVKLLPAQYYAPIDRIIEMVPGLINDVKAAAAKRSAKSAANGAPHPGAMDDESGITPIPPSPEFNPGTEM